jgi:hypothetical protein
MCAARSRRARFNGALAAASTSRRTGSCRNCAFLLIRHCRTWANLSRRAPEHPWLSRRSPLAAGSPMRCAAAASMNRDEPATGLGVPPRIRFPSASVRNHRVELLCSPAQCNSLTCWRSQPCGRRSLRQISPRVNLLSTIPRIRHPLTWPEVGISSSRRASRRLPNKKFCKFLSHSSRASYGDAGRQKHRPPKRFMTPTADPQPRR